MALLLLTLTLHVHAQDSTGASPVPPLPKPTALEGKPIFHGVYTHYSRGREYNGPVETWIYQTPEGELRALANLTFFKEWTYAESDAQYAPTQFALAREAIGQYPPFETWVTFGEDHATQSKFAPDDILKDARYRVEPGALFDYNARPDSYLLAHILLRRFKLEEGNSKEYTMSDWGNGDDGPGSFVTYKVRYEYKGMEPVSVPAARFNAHRIVATQLSSADTWYKKREGHITEFWVLDDYTIVRLVRHREPYEVQLSAADNVESLPGYEGESTIVPVFVQRHDHDAGHESHQEHQHDH